ncbi:MAG: hypothetical protein RIR12_2359 [Bacteroidota bacterium]|jgi:hypothetical protein
MSATAEKETFINVNSHLSFMPLLAALKKNIAEGNAGMKKLYGQVIEQFEKCPDLLGRIEDLSILRKHKELIEELLSAVFPPTTANFMYGVSLPFSFTAIYASPQFEKNLIPKNNRIIQLPDINANEALQQDRINFACHLVLKKFLGMPLPENTRSVYPYHDTETGLTRFMEYRVDARFVDVSPTHEVPVLPSSIVDKKTNSIMSATELIHQIPLNKFLFEGVSIIRINDVTEQEVISRIKNRLLDFNLNDGADSSVYNELEGYVKSLIGLKDLSTGITPFFKINEHSVYSDLHNTNSLLFKNISSLMDHDEIVDYCKLLFRGHHQPLLFEDIDEKITGEVQCLQYYYKQGGRSLILCPLKLKDELIGMLEIMSPKGKQLQPVHIGKIENAIPLFTLGLEKGLESLNSQVDSIIKKKFTAVQPAVEWRFTQAALHYIVQHQLKEDTKIERIVFENVYPLYGAMDIRNSSIERSKAIQADLLEQLHLAQQVVQKAAAQVNFPLLQEIEFKIEKHIQSAGSTLQTEEELMIREFLQGPVAAAFKHLHSSEAGLRNDTEKYFSSIDPQLGMLYNHRKEYEQSVSKINNILSRFVDKEQVAAQKVYPHYFERYVTDGLEYNIYIGQSISPRKKFDEIYMHNMRMWQLTMMAKAARLTHQLEAELAHPLRTTQLILSHAETLAILFRTDERKFDVDGAYNVRYEIVKKRIDKAHIKNTEERLTQPGKIAIVYSKSKDAEEYKEYIEFLQSKKLLKPGIEQVELEELQGVSGLKALRVDVEFE